ncbi:lanC-like protein 2 isoform X1 [Colletes gigas]|uniref:lanC-like protein 2 isoform X1 n=2 Tax=Colletes gigas TaxID=935657 RepID=UPI001C9A2CDF|nr:lanC-like protein 2 isoform X1 [Colletes gigas]
MLHFMLKQYINSIEQIKRLFCTKMDDTRFYTNSFKDYDESFEGSSDPTSSYLVDANTKQITEKYKGTIYKHVERLLDQLEKQKDYWTYDDDYSVYTGSAGIAYMFYQYGKCLNKPVYIDKATELLSICVQKFTSKKEITFLTGIVGPLALSAVVLHSQGNKEESQNMISKLKSLRGRVLVNHSNLPDELLYGLAGYLFALLFLNSNISPPPIEDELIKEVIHFIIQSGKIYSATRQCKSPLMYAWHNTEYIGGAHGLAGILYILLQARQYLTQAQLNEDIKPALQYLKSLQYYSGNFPSSVGNRSDKLIHWCHGAPGMSMLFCLAYEVYQDPQYLETAIKCGEVIWSRGLLKKGYGICHGVAGNAYTFLCLFQQTKDVKYLYRACQFAAWCIDYGTHQTRSPDRPFSLFEGLAGTIYFLIDMLNPLSAKFPAYTL